MLDQSAMFTLIEPPFVVYLFLMYLIYKYYTHKSQNKNLSPCIKRGGNNPNKQSSIFILMVFLLLIEVHLFMLVIYIQ
jgi:hypothetical protein